MKQTDTIKLLAVLALLGLALSASAEELKPTPPANAAPTAKPVAAKSAEAPTKATPNSTAAPAVPDVKKLPTDGLVRRKPASPEAKPLPPVAEGPQIYIVGKGETLGAIAHRFCISTKSLALWNHIADPNKLSIGQHVEIPPSNAVPRTVKSPKVAKPAAAPTAAAAPAKPAAVADPDTIRVTLSEK